ncbi:hypothetical protein B484DRAFT_442214 [Ochromonadaceae sp. CCMP2298]|nr:hypothetical protein B484DRAFT_442214 [Ochromonadaceae sp. CCMP2298]
MSDLDADEKPSDRTRRERDEKSSSKALQVREPSKKDVKDGEKKRNMKWTAFTRAKVSFGFQHLSPAYIPAMVEDPQGWCICFEKVSEWSIPAAVMKEFGDGDYEITAQLSLSLFHLASSTFYGTTWMGPSVSLAHGDSEIPKVFTFEYPDIVYLLTRITDPTCVAIVEIVVSKFDLRKNLTAAQFGCGWTILNLFKKPHPPDIAEGHENVDFTSCAIFAGSPRDLIINTDMNELPKTLQEIPGCCIYFKLYQHRRLLKARNLVSENAAMGRFDTVAGLVPRSVVPPGARGPMDVSCIGDEEHFDKRDGVLSLPATPRVATGMQVKISNCQLYMPNRRAIENKMIESYAAMAQIRDVSKVQILSRRLRVGLHNGNTVLGGDWQTHKLMEDPKAPDLLDTEARVVVVEGYTPHVFMALAFLVEYELGTPAQKMTHFNSQAMVRSTRWLDGRMVTTFTVCAAVYIPYDGRRLLLRNTGVSNPDEDEVDINLPLLKDEACRILTGRPLLVTELGKDAGGKESDKMTLRAGNKEGDDVAAVQGSGAQLEEDDPGTPLLGFDLRVVHPLKGELAHNTDMAEVLEMDRNKSSRRLEAEREVDRKHAELVDADSKGSGDELDVDATGRSRTFRQKSFGTLGKTEDRDMLVRESLRSTRELGGTLRSRTRDLDDDAASLPDSIVTGDSHHSSLRLDALYYTSQGRTRDPRSQSGAGWDALSERSDEAGGMRGMTMRDTRFSVPRERTSLLAQSLQSKLVSQEHAGQNLLQSREQLPAGAGIPPQRRDGPMTVAPKTMASSNAAHMREISRGGRSRLNRHGFDGAIVDTSLAAGVEARGERRVTDGRNVVVDVELEARDERSLHEINIQFAGYRSGAKPHQSVAPDMTMNHYLPRAVYFSFQFYSCMPTRTEVMRLLPAEPGQLCVLARDEAYAREETPLTLRFLIDCSTASPNEAAEFAEYLAGSALYVDVWDANSLLHLGTCGIPLRRLMRQGQHAVKQAVECDVINAEVGAGQANGGISSTYVAEGGPFSGTVVGAVQVIMSNTGEKGRGPSPRNARSSSSGKPLYHIENDDLFPMEGLNWRALAEGQGAGPSGGRMLSRPKNSVRAKPLSESSPELHKALSDVRRSADHSRGPSLRSLTSQRGAPGVCTLTYDEVAIIFKRFRGVMKGTVQYSGDLLSLLDMPSLGVALKKLVQAYKKFGDHEAMMKEILRHSGAESSLGARDLEEFFRVLFAKTYLKCRPEELTLLAQRFVTNGGGEQVTATQVADFCAEEADRSEWALVGQRLRLAAQRAALEGADAEQMLSEHDVSGSHHINSSRFKDFLRALNKFGNLSPKDVNLCARHFSRRARGADVDRDPVSLREVTAFLGIEYVGNLQLRVRKVVAERPKGPPDVQEMLQMLVQARGGRSDTAQQYSYEEVEEAMGQLGVYAEVSHEQAKGLLRRMDVKGTGRLSAVQVLKFLDVPFKASDLSDAAAQGQVEEAAPVDVEALLRLLLEKVRGSGVDVVEAFRHFDANGDGSISRQELTQGLTKLAIFEQVSDWKRQMPSLIRKFDKDGSGDVSLREFFAFLGIADYAPNIIQRMTKIFAFAAQKKVSVRDIFEHLDSDKSGFLDAGEIEKGLKELGEFGEVTRADAEAVVTHFDDNGDKKVSIDEFVAFFTARVNQALKERRKKRTDKVAAILRKTMTGAMRKGGASLRDIFGHLDKDSSGNIDTAELVQTIIKLPTFQKMKLTDQDASDLMATLDEDGSGDVAFSEFESFVVGDDSFEDSMVSLGTNSPVTLVDRIRATFKLAQEKGLSFEQAFQLLDADGSNGVTVDELHVALQRLPNFKGVGLREVQELFEAMDTDRSGQVTVREFGDFIKSGTLRADKRAAKGGDRDGDKGGPMDATRAKELFVRHLHRIAQIDGSVSALLAYLDDEQDGLIKLTSFRALLRREDVFDSVPEQAVDLMLEPLLQDRQHIRAGALLRFIEGRKALDVGSGEGKEGEEGELTVLQRDYDFSPDPEIRTLEKKVRGFGRILAKKGVDVEGLFQYFDPKESGAVRRTELLEVLSRLGMYLLEEGKVLQQGADAENDMARMQKTQLSRLMGTGGAYAQNAPRMARKLLMSAGEPSESDFKDHLESMTLVNWYRQSQKEMLLQRVLSHSLAHTVRIYPRFGRTSFFEFPTTNPFAHEERFQIEVGDPELRLVTAFDEWLHLRRCCRPALGELGPEPVEAEMFDRDAAGTVQVALLPHETLHLPFTFMTLTPYMPESRLPDKRQQRQSLQAQQSSRWDRDRDRGEGKEGESKSAEQEEDVLQAEEPHRTVEVKVVSCTHGHIVAIIKVLVCPRPFVLHRTLRFQEPENTVMKRRIQILGAEHAPSYPGDFSTANKYVHCVEGGAPAPGTVGAAAPSGEKEQSRVVVEWGPSSGDQFASSGALDLLLRYRCGAFPSTGAFYLLIYNDPYQSQLHEVWQVVVQTRQRLDLHCNLGCAASADLVVRGDRFARRVRAYALSSPADSVAFKPDNVFQLVPGAYNRVAVTVSPRAVGFRTVQLNLVDEDSRELVSAWLLAVSASSPAVLRSYDVEVPAGRSLHKKIVFKNPWDVPRHFQLSSSDPALMRPRSASVEVAALGSAYLRLWFSGLESGGAGVREVHLFLNDSKGGQNEECYLFRVRDV